MTYEKLELIDYQIFVNTLIEQSRINYDILNYLELNDAESLRKARNKIRNNINSLATDINHYIYVSNKIRLNTTEEEIK